MPRAHTVVSDHAAVEQPVASPDVTPSLSNHVEVEPSGDPDYEAAWNGIPENVRSGIAQRLYQNYESALQEQYGDIIPLAREAATNQQLRSALKEFASDAELRSFLAEGGTIDQLRGLQKDPEYRKFLFEDATQAYKKYLPDQRVADPMAPLSSRIEQLESRLSQEANQRVFTGYISGRKAELEALQTAAPALKEQRDLLAHVVTQAENNFKIAAANSGINVGQKDDVWAAQAVQAGIRPPSYIDVYRQYERLTGKTPPPAAPSGGSSGPRGRQQVQAPRTKVEGAQMSAEERRAKTIEQMRKRTLQAVK
jgi:hypothetical protein